MEITYLEKHTSKPYFGIASDGFSYFLTSADKIFVLDTNFQYIETIFCQRSYTQLTYDKIDNCFYAISRESPHKIFKLNSKLAEVDFVIMREFVTSICFNNSQNKLIYSNEASVFSYDKNGLKEKIFDLKNSLISGIYFEETNGLISFIKNKKQYINLYDFSDDSIKTIKLPNGYIPCQILNYNNVLVSKSGDYSYILKLFKTLELT